MVNAREPRTAKKPSGSDPRCQVGPDRLMHGPRGQQAPLWVLFGGVLAIEQLSRDRPDRSPSPQEDTKPPCIPSASSVDHSLSFHTTLPSLLYPLSTQILVGDSDNNSSSTYTASEHPRRSSGTRISPHSSSSPNQHHTRCQRWPVRRPQWQTSQLRFSLPCIPSSTSWTLPVPSRS